jgi:hypothetical protein
MYEANATEFKPSEGELPDTLRRFNLESVKGQIKSYSDSVPDSMKIMTNAALMLAIGAVLSVMFTSERAKEEQQQELEKLSQHVNLAVTTIDKSDILETSKAIDTAYIAETQSARHVKFEPKMGKTERRLKKLVPTVEMIDPDAKAT